MIIDDFIIEKKSDKIILSLSHPIVSETEEIKIEIPLSLPVYIFISKLTCDMLHVDIKNLYHLDLVGSVIKEGIMVAGSPNSIDVSGIGLKRIAIEGKIKRLIAAGCENLEDIIADEIGDIKADDCDITEEKIDTISIDMLKTIVETYDELDKEEKKI